MTAATITKTRKTRETRKTAKTAKAAKAAKAARAVTPAPCRSRDELWAYLDGELAADRRRAVARHVRLCQPCTAQARRLRAMLEACRSAGCQALPAAVRARARARVRQLVRGR